ncbi:unnamed protein product [Phytophthora fragariaefolia]|uniref:Unnamed protein product n=1 Tax=Phytophthora fragariaefolia TaxID=1490495 RepID=A0A9W6Y1Z3_9STRA|nr:unnamed protein product [Phytophthora fragariaefolia]
MKCVFTIINSNFDRLNDRIAATLPSLLTSMRQVVGYGLVLKNEHDDVVFSCQEELHPTDSDSSVCGSDGGGGRQVGEYSTASVIQHFPYGSVAMILDQAELTPTLGDILKALASSLYVAAASTGRSPE